MGHCQTVGDVREISCHSHGVTLEWEIPEFLSLPDSVDYIYYSPDFAFWDAKWYLIIFPNCQTYYGSEGWIVLFLCRRLSSPQKDVRFTLGVKRADGSQEEMLKSVRFPEGCVHIRVNDFLLRSDLAKRKSQLAPSNSLTVICTMDTHESLFVKDIKLPFLDPEIDGAPTRREVSFNLDSVKDQRLFSQQTQTEDVLDNISIDDGKGCINERGVSNLKKQFQRTVKCILKHFGNFGM